MRIDKTGRDILPSCHGSHLHMRMLVLKILKSYFKFQVQGHNLLQRFNFCCVHVCIELQKSLN